MILALSTLTGITLIGLLARQAEAGASRNFSRYYTAGATLTAEEEFYQSPRKKPKLVKSSTFIRTSESRPRSMFELFKENEALAQAKSQERRNRTAATAPIKNQLSRQAARRAELRKYLAAEAARQLEIKKWLTAEETLALEKLRQVGEAERQRLAVAEARTEANLTDAEPIPAGEQVKVGQWDARVPMIRARMVKLGFLSEENSLAWMLGHPADKVPNPSDLEWILDKKLSKAIKAFQKANGIEQSGWIDEATVAALNSPETAAKQRQVEEERKAQEAALALAKQRQAEDAERQRLAAEAAAKQRQAEDERKAQEAALALAKQQQAEEAERQRLAAETAAKQRQAEDQRKAQEAALALAKQRQAEEAERQRLAAETAAKQRQAEDERKAQEAALALAKQRQAEDAERLADKAKVASLDNASEADEASSKSCNKAKSVIGKYGFEDIETKSCTGKIYHFSATRTGTRFSVKINALTSELTEIKKVLSSAAE